MLVSSTLRSRTQGFSTPVVMSEPTLESIPVCCWMPESIPVCSWMPEPMPETLARRSTQGPTLDRRSMGERRTPGLVMRGSTEDRTAVHVAGFGLSTLRFR